MFEYQQKQRFFAQTQRGLEPLARAELEELGAEQCSESFCGVYFRGSLQLVYKINYCARIINRVLAPLVSFDCDSTDRLYKEALRFPWARFFTQRKTFAIIANVSDSRITHSRYAALKLKDAIADYFRNKTGRRPNVDPKSPDMYFNLNIRKNRAVISLDTSGESLHKRGYRKTTVSAPIQETLGAAILRLSGWTGEQPLLDPMCGSGTFLAEALMTYCRIPAAFKRETFGFFHLPDYEHFAWKDVRDTCSRDIRDCPDNLISGSDIDPHAVEATLDNLNQIPSGYRVTVQKKDFRDLKNSANRCIITNPPYGIRMGETERLYSLYAEIGDYLKQECTGSTAFILCGEKELTKQIGLKISKRTPLYNGPLDSRLVRIELY